MTLSPRKLYIRKGQGIEPSEGEHRDSPTVIKPGASESSGLYVVKLRRLRSLWPVPHICGVKGWPMV